MLKSDSFEFRSESLTTDVRQGFSDASHTDWHAEKVFRSPRARGTSRVSDIMLPMAFIQQSGTHFINGADSFYFAGANVYYLIYKSTLMVDSVLDAAQAMGLRVVRTWGFLDIGSLDGTVPSIDPPGPKEGIYFQHWDPVASAPAFNDSATGLERLDYSIFAAGRRGLRVILPLINNWRDFGGIDQYVAWYGLGSHNDFYSDPDCRQAYRGWVSQLLNRVNIYTGVRYGDDQTILAWELTNEGRCNGDPASMLDWVRQMSGYIKSLDSNHLVAVGDEGFLNRDFSPDWTYDGSQGSDFEAFLGVPAVDFGTFHLYPDTWGMDRDYGSYWIDDHLSAGSRAGKPVVLAEYGWRDQATRNDVYQDWLDRMYNQGGAGDLVWMLAGQQDDGTLYPDFDGFTVYKSTAPASILTHASQMATRA
jgi:mannan endo-1,4-beta-mannosidase